ncbi:MAG: UDP-N-acetylmuramoyl-L-alanyl-D-glutamate--2,6-diaminopimelate ligase, partial [Bacilli bacterium]|nr:UDP-N-acetylmuramoyl-L-alanyl-D-glutamate--2,6-diaminopimelate ligase [Bacilli bacterium]
IDIIKYKTNSIVIDYAHTPDAMENVFALVNNINHNNVYTVFGCTGSRERTKRPIMMNIATKNSKYVVVTIDDPHEENIHQIFDDMLEGNTNTNYEVIEVRGEAIKKGISLLNNNDILLILGKGHEENIIYKDKKVPFNDRKKVEEILKMSE